MANPATKEASGQETMRLSSEDGWNTLLGSLKIRREQTPHDVLKTLRGLEESAVDKFEEDLTGCVTWLLEVKIQDGDGREEVVQEGRPREWKVILEALQGLWQDAGRPGSSEDLHRSRTASL